MENPETSPIAAEETPEAQLLRLDKELSTTNPADAPKQDDKLTPAGEQQPPADEKQDAPKPDSKPTDTPLEADKEVETAKADAEKEGKELKLGDDGKPARDAAGKFIKQDKPKAEPDIALSEDEKKKFSAYLKQSQSKFGADLGKRLVRWDTIKQAEAKLETDKVGIQKEIDTRIAKFNADVQAFRAEQEGSKPTVEKYEAFSSKCSDAAKVNKAEAIVAENEGRIEDAEKLRDEAKFLERDANAAKNSAEHLRKNPPATVQQRQEQFQKQQREWIGKAVTDFPEYGKKGSELQAAVAEVFKTITTQNPEAARLPGLIYYCVEMASYKSAANHVPEMEKELGELRTKLTEADALLNPTPSGGVQRQTSGRTKPKTIDEEFAELQKEAAMRV